MAIPQVEKVVGAAHVRTVSQLVAEAKGLLQAAFSGVWVEGEVSNCKKSGAGHSYFTLKDPQAQISAVIWRSDLVRVRFDLTDGLHVLAFGDVDVYPARGQLQFVVRQLVPKGIGALELAFRQLCERLSAEGLFRVERKRPLPQFPRRIAVVTSPRGAAIRDFLEVAGRRWRATEIIVVPASVQGDAAAPELRDALCMAQKLEIDAVALIRGGGSLEDLWAFNDENLARTIAACRVPVVTGIGHEVDVTVADLVADVRALTPSEAAERIFPDVGAVRRSLEQSAHRLARGLRAGLERAEQRLNLVLAAPHLRRPLELVRDAARRVDEFEQSVLRAILSRRDVSSQRLERLGSALDVLSPLRALGRGYSLALSPSTGKLIRSINEVIRGDELAIRVVDGRILTQVIDTESEDARAGPEL
jgi:exodeoxyribonuclease VII large subunit